MQLGNYGQAVLTSGSDLNVASEGPIVAPKGPDLDSGSSLNRASSGSPWPPILSQSIKLFSAHRANGLRQTHVVKVVSNYGSITSAADFQFRSHEYDGIGGYATNVPSAHRPTYNTLDPITWGMQTQIPSQNAQPGEIGTVTVISNGALEYTGGSQTSSLFTPENIGGS